MAKRKLLPVQSPGVEVRPIPGYEGHYSVTDDGCIWSHAKAGRHGGRWLIPQTTSHGYLKVVLFVGKRGKGLFVHRAVALAWIPNPDGLPCINHRNGIKKDCCVGNLEWCTVAHNNVHAFATGLNVRSRMLTDDQIREIKAAKGIRSQRALALELGVSDTTVWRFQRGRDV